jgi:hypothetical protein
VVFNNGANEEAERGPLGPVVRGGTREDAAVAPGIQGGVVCHSLPGVSLVTWTILAVIN